MSKRKTNTIGILGGMGSYATVEIFRRMVEAFPAEKEWDRPRILIDNNCIMPSRVRAILYNEKREELIQQMSDSIDFLAGGGANQIILGCITAHCFFEYLPHQELLINVVQETANQIDEREITVLCTEGTKDVRIWDRMFPNSKIIYPDEGQMEQLRQYIEVVKQGKLKQEIKQDFLQYVDNFPGENILLGCTELPILYGNQVGNKKIIDPIQCAIDKMKKET